MQMKLVAGAIATLVIGLGIYAILSLSGNLPNQALTSDATTSGGSNEVSCQLSIDRGRKLDEAATGDIAAFRGVDEPLDMTYITFKDGAGNPKTLADWNGKLVLFNLWATWCPPCREEMPYFEVLQNEKGGEQFEVVPVSIDRGSDEKPKAFYEQIGLKAVGFYQDETMEAFQSLRKKGVALGMPTTLLVDTNGCALGVLNGPAHWASEDALRMIDLALGMASAK